MSTQTQMSTSERIEALVRKVNQMIDWTLIRELIELMAELIINGKDSYFTASDRRKIHDLGTRLEMRIVELAKEEASDYINDFKLGDVEPQTLRYQKQVFYGYAEDAPTSLLRQTFRKCAQQIRDALDKSSEEHVSYHVDNAERAIVCAEEIVANENRGERDLSVAENNLRDAENSLEKIRRRSMEGKLGHLWYVGLPRVAKKRGMSADDLYNDLWQKIRDAWQTFAPLWMTAEEQRQIQAEQELERAREEYRQQVAQEEQQRRTQSVEQIVCSIEKRNRQAGQVARQFLEHVKLGDAGAAWLCLNTITRLDNGVDPVLKAEWQKIA